jgi:hypothetical protein
MHLRRTPKNGKPYTEHRKPPYQVGRDGCATVSFNNYGKDHDNRVRWHRFEVEMNWLDVEGLILAFQKTKHPKAARINRALKLAASIEALMKAKGSPHSN